MKQLFFISITAISYSCSNSKNEPVKTSIPAGQTSVADNETIKETNSSNISKASVLPD